MSAGKPKPEPGRCTVAVNSGQQVSALVWGEVPARAAFLHGRGQNAFTWSSVVRELGWSAVSVDLPGHGHSDWREDHDYGPWPNADAVAPLLEAMSPKADVLVGASLAGATATRLASRYPHLAQRIVIIDSTPESRDGRVSLTAEQRCIGALLDGPLSFGSIEEMIEAAAVAFPRRGIQSLRRGVVNNARQLDDGRWIWRYDRESTHDGADTPRPRTQLWHDVAAISSPIMLVIGGRSGRVQQSDIDEMRRRQPTVRVEVVVDAGHSVQSDQPQKLAILLRDFVSST